MLFLNLSYHRWNWRAVTCHDTLALRTRDRVLFGLDQIGSKIRLSWVARLPLVNDVR